MWVACLFGYFVRAALSKVTQACGGVVLRRLALLCVECYFAASGNGSELRSRL